MVDNFLSHRTNICIKTSLASVINMHVIFLLVKIETYIHFVQLFYLLIKTWKYDGGVFGTEVAAGA